MLRIVQNNTESDTRSIMSQSKFYEAYSRWNDTNERYETWDESVARVMNMHREYYEDKMTPELSQLIDEAESLYKLQYALGAQRALQFGGDQLLKHQMRMYNCTSSYCFIFFCVALELDFQYKNIMQKRCQKFPKEKNKQKVMW